MPKFKVKMTWLDTYVQEIEAPTEAEAIVEAEAVGEWGDPIWGGEDQDTWAEEIKEDSKPVADARDQHLIRQDFKRMVG